MATKFVRFVGDPNDPNEPGSGPNRITVKGVEFVKNEWLELDEAVAAKFASHTHFETDAEEDEDDDAKE